MLIVTRFVSPSVAATVTPPMFPSGSVTMNGMLFVTLSSRIVCAATLPRIGASLTGVTPMLNVFVTESLPPLVVPPLSFITTVIKFVPKTLVAVLNINVPFVLMAGAVANAKFVPDVTVNVNV